MGFSHRMARKARVGNEKKEEGKSSMDFSKRNFVVMLFAIVLMGLGISLFKISVMGNDPSTAMVIAIGDTIGVNFSLVLIVFNSIWFVIELNVRELVRGGDHRFRFCRNAGKASGNGAEPAGPAQLYGDGHSDPEPFCVPVSDGGSGHCSL